MATKRTFRLVLTAGVLTVVAAASLTWTLGTPAAAKTGGQPVAGGGTTIVEGGTGIPDFAPVITKFAFHARDGSGRFECLALASSAAAGSPGSGTFDRNVMYVTGTITSVAIKGDTAVLEGTATVTGVGAGSDRPFTATVTRGGPGATLDLEVSGLTFNETVLEGQIDF